MSGNPTPASTVSSLEASDFLGNSISADIDPIVTLFDNAIWRRRSSDRASEKPSDVDGVGGSEVANKRIRTREALLSDIIAPELRDMIINATCSWWHTWNPLGSRRAKSPIEKTTSTLPDFVLWAFESPDPSIIGVAILCVAVCLQQLDTRVNRYIIRQLPSLPGALFQEYFEKVDRLIINDSDYASTEEGIEVIVFSAKIYMNLGLNRKCWILTHQAIAYSQLLSHHRPIRLSPNETSTQIHHRTQSWLSLCSSDVYLSLLLGLPYAADGRTIPLTQNKNNPTAFFHHKLTLLSAKVIDRNQNGQSLSVLHTTEIQTELDLVTKNLDDAFWNAPTLLAAGNITREEYLEQIAAQCYGACRNGNHGIGQSHDKDLISQAIAMLRQASCTVNNPIARQAVQGLESLMLLGDSECPLKSRGNISGDINLDLRAKIVVPYVGVITITPGEYYTSEKAGLPTENSMMSEGAQTGSLLRFTLSDDFFDGYHGSLPQRNFEADKDFQNPVEVRMGGENNNEIPVELTSIDFDWESTLTTNFEDDWAWLNEMSH
ncbi:hypothetical protein DID88_000654 [Monilinia fructigena]|uniref:Transcription factor domain-containing protein n=1 Tax=Monilinia fructigena TaxID=38457 RepID=A0A395IKI3_9HELO|nr:hypothetical protein DID88_000654 [Monilinia fructigena]